jgi:uncharacterized caspase-like protein
MHGVFTYALLEGLAGHADTGKIGTIDVLSLVTYVKQRVPELSETLGHRQFPQFSVSGENFVLARYSTTDIQP